MSYSVGPYTVYPPYPGLLSNGNTPEPFYRKPPQLSASTLPAQKRTLTHSEIRTALLGGVAACVAGIVWMWQRSNPPGKEETPPAPERPKVRITPVPKVDIRHIPNYDPFKDMRAAEHTKQHPFNSYQAMLSSHFGKNASPAKGKPQ